MKNESFRAAASRAIDEGSRERRASVKRLASQFETGAEFDLRSLERLGQQGLAAFLSSIGHHNPSPKRREPERTPHVQSSAVPEPGKDYGWALLQSREPRWFVRALVRGWAAGFGLVIIGSILLRVLE